MSVDRTETLWRSLEEKEGQGTRAPVGDVEGPGAAKLVQLGRRGFLGVTGATAAVGLAGCVRRPVENIMPFAEGPEYVVPGVPLHFATVTERRGDAIGLLVTSHEGRPTKIEGNPAHPRSGGGTDIFAQASILDLYDPNRSQEPAKRQGAKLSDVTAGEADEALRALFDGHQGDRGARLRFLAPPTNSPTFVRLRDAVKARFPSARFHTYTSVSDSNAATGARLALGIPVRTQYNLEDANVILALDSDFLATEPGAIVHARGFAVRRALPTPNPARPMSRLYVVEGGFSLTGTNADHRLRLPPSHVGRYLMALAKELGRRGVIAGELAAAVQSADAAGIPKAWIEGVAADLAAEANKGRAPIVVGSGQPAWVHALAHGLNDALGNIGSTVGYFQPTDAAEPEHLADLAALVSDVLAGRVATLVMLGGNPVYDAPSDLDFAGVLAKEGLTSVHLSSHRDETSELSTWHIPRAHELEAWGDQRALDGTVAVQQPLIAPLYPAARSELEVLAAAAGLRNTRGHHLVRATVRGDAGEDTAFERKWRATLHTGRVPSEVAPPQKIAVDPLAISQALGAARSGPAVGPDSLEVEFRADYAMFDGRYANNPWMLELANPLTKVAWDNATWMSPATAAKLGVETGDVVRLSREGGKPIDIAAFVLPGQADWVLTLPLGWGRRAAGKYGNGAGFDVHALRTSEAFHFASGVRLEKTGATHELASLQTHGYMEGRPLAQDGTLEPVHTDDPRYRGMPSFKENPKFARYASVTPSVGPLWTEVDYTDRLKWGMAIDLSACTGCNTCVIACQAENNIPAVGKVQAGVGRAMYWLRIDRYFVGDDTNDPLVAMQPVACQHCEEAPCENVCPVNATTHSPEGINAMAYNRCIGTRYCMNNCPYKVRRFNYLNWTGYIHDMGGDYGDMPETYKMQQNPNVSVRFRGVMEKCTFCVQRIEGARIEARREGRKFTGKEVTPACAQACPTHAIAFGNLNDATQEVTRLSQLDRAYHLLGVVGTQPRTAYLARLRNPNPALLAEKAVTESAKAAAAAEEVQG